MRKLIASINVSIDGFCDHTAMVAVDEIHDHYTELLKNTGTLLYGRITYQMMESYWPTIVKNPTGEKHMDDFAKAIHHVDKIVFSKTLKELAWENASLATKSLEEEVRQLKQQPGKDIFAGSPSVISALTKLNLVDEYQLCIHPVIAGSGLPLFKNISEKITLRLVNTKTFKSSGAVIHYYEPKKDT